MISENDKIVSVHFDNILELMNSKPESDYNRIKFSKIMNDTKLRKQSWRGGMSSKEIISNALLGDTETYNKSLVMLKKLNSYTGANAELQRVQKAKRIKFKSDSGDELDIHKVYQGNLSQAWTKIKRVELDSKHHLVTLFLNIIGRSDIEFNETIWRCALITKLTNELQQAGKSVKVIVGGVVNDAMIGSRKKMTVSINVKKYNETLSPERLAAMSNIGFYRVFGFAAKEFQNNKVPRDGGYSSMASKDIMPIGLENEISMGHTKPIFISGVTSEGEARRELKSAFNQMQNI